LKRLRKRLRKWAGAGRHRDIKAKIKAGELWKKKVN
jgi:hypothetical protein